MRTSLTPLEQPVFGVRCPYCGSRDVIRIGHISRKTFTVQRFQCKVCGRTFTELEGTPFKGIHSPKSLLAVAYLKFRVGLDEVAISKLLGLPYLTVKRLSSRARQSRNFIENVLNVILESKIKCSTNEHSVKFLSDRCSRSEYSCSDSRI